MWRHYNRFVYMLHRPCKEFFSTRLQTASVLQFRITLQVPANNNLKSRLVLSCARKCSRCIAQLSTSLDFRLLFVGTEANSKLDYTVIICLIMLDEDRNNQTPLRDGLFDLLEKSERIFLLQNRTRQKKIICTPK